jgi:hypothetical protein
MHDADQRQATAELFVRNDASDDWRAVDQRGVGAKYRRRAPESRKYLTM